MFFVICKKFLVNQSLKTKNYSIVFLQTISTFAKNDKFKILQFVFYTPQKLYPN